MALIFTSPFISSRIQSSCLISLNVGFLLHKEGVVMPNKYFDKLLKSANDVCKEPTRSRCMSQVSPQWWNQLDVLGWRV